MLSNYPDNVTGNEDIFGDHDQIISFSITFPYTIFNEDNEDLTQVIHTYTGMSDLEVDLSSVMVNIDESITVDLTYSDDICLDVRGMDASDIEHYIVDYMNHDVRILDATIDHRSDSISIDFEVHN